jgi:hypothetical protein
LRKASFAQSFTAKTSGGRHFCDRLVTGGLGAWIRAETKRARIGDARIESDFLGKGESKNEGRRDSLITVQRAAPLSAAIPRPRACAHLGYRDQIVARRTLQLPRAPG